MSTSATPDPAGSESPASLAVELASLRDHFGTAPVATTPLPPNVQRGAYDETLVDRRSPLPLDNAFVQQTKDQIRSIVESIAALANSPIEPTEFIQAALPRIVQAMGATGAAIWQELPDSEWRLLGHFQLPPTLVNATSDQQEPRIAGGKEDLPPTESPFEQLEFLEVQLNQDKAISQASLTPTEPWSRPSPSHLSVLNAVAKEKQPILIPPSNVLLVRDRPTNPTNELLMFAPLPIAKDHGSYWLQVVQAPSGGPSSQRGYLRFVAQMADLISDHFRSFRLRVLERDRNYLSLAESTMHELSAGIPPAIGLSRLMGILRSHGHAEHAFLLRRDSYFGRWRVVAAAGLIEIDRRAEGIEQIELASNWFQSQFPKGGSRRTEDFSDSVDQRDPDLTRLLHTFSVSEAMWVKPLQTIGGNEKPKSNMDVAVLVLWAGNATSPSRCLEQTALISRLGLSALQVPWWRSALVASKNYRSITSTWLNPAAWPRLVKAMVLIALCAGIGAIPVPISLDATAILIPSVQQHVYTPIDSIVEEVYVDHGQQVKAGQPLLKLQSPSISAAYDQAVALQLRSAQRISDLESRLLREPSLTSAQRDELEGELQTVYKVQNEEHLKMTRFRNQLDSMLIVAEQDSVVATWNLHETLRDRPLRTGQWLLSLHESNSSWVFEAALPEQDAFEFRQAIKSNAEQPVATLTSSPQKPIPVKYLPNSTPRIENLQQDKKSFESNSSVLRMRFEVDPSLLDLDTSIAGSTARISIPNGRGPLAWAVSKDFLKNVWTRIQMWM